MKKVIAIVLALIVVIGLVACATTGNNDETTTLEETTAGEMTVAATFVEAFKAEAVKEGATANTIATALSTNETVAFMPMVQDMEADAWLAGFDAETMTGYEACTAFMPMIGTIPFVSYVFELAEGADVDAFKTTLSDNANLRWNICTAAEEMLIETEGNFVFFIMAPLSFEQPEEETEGEVEGGDIAEDELDGPAAFDPEAETVEDETVAEETVEETTAA